MDELTEYLIELIAVRAVTGGAVSSAISHDQVINSIALTHSNHRMLLLRSLLAATFDDFSSDINGILNNIEQGTGRLLNGFVPRFATGPGKWERAEWSSFSMGKQRRRSSSRGVNRLIYFFYEPLDLVSALEMGIDLWRYLAETGMGGKPQTNFHSNCPLCTYGGPPVHLDCTRCPVQWIDGVWPNTLYACVHNLFGMDGLEGLEDPECPEDESKTTPYVAWHRAWGREARQEAAAAIVAEMEKVLEEVKKCDC